MELFCYRSDYKGEKLIIKNPVGAKVEISLLNRILQDQNAHNLNWLENILIVSVP